MLTALIIGGASKVWAEIDAAHAIFAAAGLGEPDAYFVTNDMIAHWQRRADYACSLHPDKLPSWLKARAKGGHPMPGEVWSHKHHGPRPGMAYHHVNRVIEDWAGSSGLFATKVALTEGFQKIVLAGVPMERGGRHVVRNKVWTAADAFLSAWKARRTQLEPYVRSMSGWTQNLLGAPTPGWLVEQIRASELSSVCKVAGIPAAK